MVNKIEIFQKVFNLREIQKALFSCAYNFTKRGGGKTPRISREEDVSPFSRKDVSLPPFQPPVSVLVRRCVGEQD